MNDYLNEEQRKLLNASDDLCDLVQRLVEIKIPIGPKLLDWWTYHQLVDKARAESELMKARTNQEKSEALNKLTPYERKLLGI